MLRHSNRPNWFQLAGKDLEQRRLPTHVGAAQQDRAPGTGMPGQILEHWGIVITIGPRDAFQMNSARAWNCIHDSEIMREFEDYASPPSGTTSILGGKEIALYSFGLFSALNVRQEL